MSDKVKTYRFFYHYFRQYNEMTVHFRGLCMRVKNVQCEVGCETKWSNKQPYLVMRGFCTTVEIHGDTAIIK